MAGSNGWDEWRRHVLKELERLSDKGDDVDTSLKSLSCEIIALRERSTWKATAVAVISGFLPTAALVIYFVLTKGAP